LVRFRDRVPYAAAPFVDSPVAPFVAVAISPISADPRRTEPRFSTEVDTGSAGASRGDGDGGCGGATFGDGDFVAGAVVTVSGADIAGAASVARIGLAPVIAVSIFSSVASSSVLSPMISSLAGDRQTLDARSVNAARWLWWPATRSMFRYQIHMQQGGTSSVGRWTPQQAMGEADLYGRSPECVADG
jgi:hypothetical protein